MSAIALTPLELFLGGAFVSLFTAVAVRLWAGSKFVCQADFRDVVNTMKESNNIQYRMLRAIVLYLPVEDAVKQQILNERGSES